MNRRAKETSGINRGIYFCAILLCALFPFFSQARAHGVTVFAWLEGGTVHTESTFSGGDPVYNGKIRVTDLQGETLLEGETDENGKFSFSLPDDKHPIKIILYAGMGHRAEWTLINEESKRAQNPSDRAPQPVHEERTPSGTTKTDRFHDAHSEEIRIAVEKAMDKKLEPVISMLENSRHRGADIRDILGGIGYILGLFGIAAYILSRRSSSENGEKPTEQNGNL